MLLYRTDNDLVFLNGTPNFNSDDGTLDGWADVIPRACGFFPDP